MIRDRAWQKFCFPAALAVGLIAGLLCGKAALGAAVGALTGVALHMLVGYFCLPKGK